MLISYSNLWKMLIDKGLKKTDLIKIAGISSSTLANMGKNQSISLETVARICVALDCNIEDIVSIDITRKSKKGKISFFDTAQESLNEKT